MLRDRLLSPYQHGVSRVHGWPPGHKLAAALAGVLLVVLLPRGAWALFGSVESNGPYMLGTRKWILRMPCCI